MFPVYSVRIEMMKLRKKLIDSKKAERECRNCAFGVLLSDKEKVFCKKSGVRNTDSFCKKFKYDPLCRVPRRKPDIKTFSEEDFSL